MTVDAPGVGVTVVRGHRRGRGGYRTSVGTSLTSTGGSARCSVHILLGLELPRGADIVRTVAAKPTLTSVAVLGAIVPSVPS